MDRKKKEILCATEAATISSRAANVLQTSLSSEALFHFALVSHEWKVTGDKKCIDFMSIQPHAVFLSK